MALTTELLGWRCDHIEIYGPGIAEHPPTITVCGCTLEPIYETDG